MIRLLLLTFCGFLVFQAASANCSCLLPNFTHGNTSYSPSQCLCPFNQSNASYPFYPCYCPFYDPNQTISPCPTPCPCPFNTTCSLPPRPVLMTTVQADFTENVTSGDAPLTVKFTDKSSGRPNSWLWDFGDGSTSSRQNPVHTYTSAGTYTVTLTAGTVFDQGGVHSGISTVVRKENLITVTGTVQAVQSAVIPTLQNQAPASTGLSPAQIEAFLSHRSSPATQGRQVTDLPSPGENGILTADTTGVSSVVPAIPGSISGTGRDLLQNRLQTGQSGSTAALLIRQRISG